MAKRRTAQEWRRIVEDWGCSGLSKHEFAESIGVNPGTLGWWRWRFRSEPALPAFIDVVVHEDQVVAPDFDLTVGNIGVRVPVGFDARELERLLAVLC